MIFRSKNIGEDKDKNWIPISGRYTFSQAELENKNMDPCCIGSVVRLIESRISDIRDTENYKIYFPEGEDVSTNLETAKNLSIKSSTSDILKGSIYNPKETDLTKKIIVPSQHTIDKGDDGLQDIGFDGSCFEIWKETNPSGQLRALVKIFVRKTHSDVEDDFTDHALDKISCLALCMGDPKKPGESTLFSRVVFPPYYKSSSQAIVFNYYIYF